MAWLLKDWCCSWHMVLFDLLCHMYL